MSKPFFVIGITALALATLLFFPIFLETDIFYDMNRKKLGFAVFLYKILKITGGYIGTYAGGIAWHISKNRAILVPYSRLDSERKRFSFLKTFRLRSLKITTETGAEYLLPVGIIHTVLRAWTIMKLRDVKRIRNNFWLTDGDTLRIAVNSVLYFNMFILLKAFMAFLKEKWRFLWKKDMKKSTN